MVRTNMKIGTLLALLSTIGQTGCSKPDATQDRIDVLEARMSALERATGATTGGKSETSESATTLVVTLFQPGQPPQRSEHRISGPTGCADAKREVDEQNVKLAKHFEEPVRADQAAQPSGFAIGRAVGGPPFATAECVAG